MFKFPQSCRTAKRIALLVYTVIMLLLLFKRTPGSDAGAYWDQLTRQINLSPFHTINAFLRSFLHGGLTQKRLAIVNLVGNVIMFVPLGFFVPCIWQKTRKFGWHVLAMALVIVVIELLQLFTLLGSCDVDDLLLNLVGTTIGFVFWKLCNRLKK